MMPFTVVLSVVGPAGVHASQDAAPDELLQDRIRPSTVAEAGYPDRIGVPIRYGCVPSPVSPVTDGRLTAGCPSGQRERSVKPPAQPTLVRTQHPPPRLQ